MFVPYELALRIKELGFDEKCFGWWSYINGTTASFYGYHCTNSELIELNSFNKNCTAPLWQQALDWFREEFGIRLEIVDYFDEKKLPLSENIGCKPLGYFIWDSYNDSFNEEYATKFNTYEEARLECIRKLIELVENKKG